MAQRDSAWNKYTIFLGSEVREERRRNGGVELTAEVWKAMTERKSSEFFLPKERDADELRKPENSVNLFPFACKQQATRPIREKELIRQCKSFCDLLSSLLKAAERQCRDRSLGNTRLPGIARRKKA